MDFEKKMAELEKVNEKLSGNISISESIVLFEKSLEITKECMNFLNEAKGKISQIKSDFDQIISEY